MTSPCGCVLVLRCQHPAHDYIRSRSLCVGASHHCAFAHRMYMLESQQKGGPPPPTPTAIDLYKDRPADPDEEEEGDMIMEAVTPSTQLGDSDDPRCVAPKKRAETWVQDETRSLISLRRETDSLFNTSKSNKHLWEQISARMRERGFDRSPTMCTDKWRNLLKEFKKAKQQHNNTPAKMSYYKEIDDILRERTRSAPPAAAPYRSPNSLIPTFTSATASASSSKLDPFLQLSDKGIQDSSIPYGPIEANDRQALNLERSLDHDGHALAITTADTVVANGGPPSCWRENPGNGDETRSFVGRVITVKWGGYTRRIGVDGTADAISHAIKSAFGIRTKRAFWLEDEDLVVRSLDRDMPLGNYTLHLDEGVTIKVCQYDESDHIPLQTEEKTFYSEDDLREFLNRRGWSAFRELHGYRSVDHLDDLRCDALYRGVT